jgi:hypothetical protein
VFDSWRGWEFFFSLEVYRCKKIEKLKMLCAHKSDAAAVCAKLKAVSKLKAVYLYHVQTGSGALPSSFTVDTVGFLPGYIVTGA